MTTIRCEAPYCQPRDLDTGRIRSSQVLPGLRLCSVCRDRVEDDLVALSGRYERCEGNQALPGRGGRSRGLCIEEAVLTLRSDMLASLLSWTVAVVRERHVAAPQKRHLPRLVEFLTGHLDWLAAHPAAAAFASEIAELTLAADGMLVPDATARIALAPCGHPDCGRTVYATVRAGQTVTRQQATCGAGHVLRPDQWNLLSRQIAEVHQLDFEQVKSLDLAA